jgi:hypothetical protein
MPPCGSRAPQLLAQRRVSPKGGALPRRGGREALRRDAPRLVGELTPVINEALRLKGERGWVHARFEFAELLVRPGNIRFLTWSFSWATIGERRVRQDLFWSAQDQGTFLVAPRSVPVSCVRADQSLVGGQSRISLKNRSSRDQRTTTGCVSHKL